MNSVEIRTAIRNEINNLDEIRIKARDSGYPKYASDLQAAIDRLMKILESK